MAGKSSAWAKSSEVIPVKCAIKGRNVWEGFTKKSHDSNGIPFTNRTNAISIISSFSNSKPVVSKSIATNVKKF